ncbi:aspartate carbamoyltransferase regulatory subunit [Blautia faecis]|uniref:aspartate carbamoyltransferase regulatory subunit n=1 Tax=Blautia faecis TaxID=871665 RepID=UPI0022E2809E|nr:aspartate carbamoyltransferase regulatory subunit [Blautia faecis]
MLKIESIQNGIVIDHIPAGKGMDIYKLGLTEPERLEVLGYLNDGVTLIVIRDGKVVKKYHPVPPRTLKNVIKCKNPRCITSTEANCEHIFKLSSSGKYRCIYCNQEASLLR